MSINDPSLTTIGFYLLSSSSLLDPALSCENFLLVNSDFFLPTSPNTFIGTSFSFTISLAIIAGAGVKKLDLASGFGS
jgi:hypothetical protein